MPAPEPPVLAAPPSTPGVPTLTVGSNPNNTGQFTLSWTASSDLNGDAVTYTLQHKDANDLAFSDVASGLSSNSYSFAALSAEGEGTWVYRVQASDGNLSSDFSAASVPIVVDRSAPSAPGARASGAPDYDPVGTADDWYRDTVTVTFTATGDPFLQDGSPGSGVAAVTAPTTFATSGAHSALGTATDAASNVSTATALSVQVDAENPVVAFTSCPSPVSKNSSQSAVWSARDASSGLASAASGSVAMDTSTVGLHSVAAPLATDNVGHTSAPAACTYEVRNDAPTTPGAPTLSSGSNPNRSGQFTLTWTASTDPNGDAVTYTLQHKDADDLAFSDVASGLTANLYAFAAVSAEPEGTWRYRVRASDGDLASAFSPESVPIVVDKTAPNSPSASADRPPEYAPAGAPAWWKDTVTVSFAPAGDPPLLDGSAGSGVPLTGGVSEPKTFTTSGQHTALGTATDRAGNTSAATSLSVRVDAENPVVTFTSCPSPVDEGSAISAAWSATDASSGLASAASGSVAPDTATVGSNSVAAPTAADNVGHTSAGAFCSYSVADLLPSITVDKSASPGTVPEPGGPVTFTVKVTNTSPASSDPVTLTSLVDDKFGDLNGKGTCATGVTVAVGTSHTCSFVAQVTGTVGLGGVAITHTDTVTVTAVDNDPAANVATHRDSETVSIVFQSNPQCTAVGGGQIADPKMFALRVFFTDGALDPLSTISYKDTRARQDFQATGATIAGLACYLTNGTTHAAIVGTATVNRQTGIAFRVDLDHAPSGDVFSIQWPGYSASGTPKPPGFFSIQF